MNDTLSPPMTSNRPYLLRAIYDWIIDNHLTPYVLVDVSCEAVKVPRHVVQNHRVVLNLGMHAVADLQMGNDGIGFRARFSGVSHHVYIPVQAVLALYAQENGKGMLFPGDDDHEGTPPPSSPGSPVDNGNSPRFSGRRLHVVK